MHDLSLARFAVMFLAGAGTGVIGAILGTGGGVVLIPILVLGMGMPMHHAVAASLCSVVATSSAVASTNVERGLANMRLGMTLEIATALGAIAGGLVAGWLSHGVLEAVFGIVLFPAAILMWRGRGTEGAAHADRSSASRHGPLGLLGAQYRDDRTGGVIAYRVRRLWAGLGISLFAGGVSGLLGIGGGVFKVPALHLFCEVPMKAAAATSNFMIGVTAAAGAFLYYGRGDVPTGLTAAVVLGVLAGSALGSILNRRIGGESARRLFAALLMLVSVQMIYRAWTSRG